jgi:RimJ/RimL family protein N-acetyltransferase
MIFETKRLLIRKATTSNEDVDLFYSLWINPQVMINVGFPSGLKITREEIIGSITNQDDSEYNHKLIVIQKDSADPIGECKLGLPDDDGISETDVKLLPQYWGNGYGTEIKHGLVDYLFTHTHCKAIKATPNKNNIPSQKMQEAVGSKKVDEGVYHFPEDMRDYTVDVTYYVYIVTRKDWENLQ